MVKLLIEKGASVHSVTYGGHTPYHLTYGRSNDDIQKVLYELTSPHLRELPESDSEDSEDSDEDYEERCPSEVEEVSLRIPVKVFIFLYFYKNVHVSNHLPSF